MTGEGRAVCFPDLNGTQKKRQAGTVKNRELAATPRQSSG